MAFASKMRKRGQNSANSALHRDSWHLILCFLPNSVLSRRKFCIAEFKRGKICNLCKTNVLACSAMFCILNSKKHQILCFSILPYPDSVIFVIGIKNMNIHWDLESLLSCQSNTNISIAYFTKQYQDIYIPMRQGHLLATG